MEVFTFDQIKLQIYKKQILHYLAKEIFGDLVFQEQKCPATSHHSTSQFDKTIQSRNWLMGNLSTFAPGLDPKKLKEVGGVTLKYLGVH
jgi:hypothetical protein